MIAAFQGQLERREIAVMSNEVWHYYSLQRRMEFVMPVRSIQYIDYCDIVPWKWTEHNRNLSEWKTKKNSCVMLNEIYFTRHRVEDDSLLALYNFEKLLVTDTNMHLWTVSYNLVQRITDWPQNDPEFANATCSKTSTSVRSYFSLPTSSSLLLAIVPTLLCNSKKKNKSGASTCPAPG